MRLIWEHRALRPFLRIDQRKIFWRPTLGRHSDETRLMRVWKINLYIYKYHCNHRETDIQIISNILQIFFLMIPQVNHEDTYILYDLFSSGQYFLKHEKELSLIFNLIFSLRSWSLLKKILKLRKLSIFRWLMSF